MRSLKSVFPCDKKIYRRRYAAHVSRMVLDLEKLIAELRVADPVSLSSTALDELRLTVARINELRRQLDIVQLKIAAVLSFTGMKAIEQKVEFGDTSHFSDIRLTR